MYNQVEETEERRIQPPEKIIQQIADLENRPPVLFHGHAKGRRIAEIRRKIFYVVNRRIGDDAMNVIEVKAIGQRIGVGDKAQDAQEAKRKYLRTRREGCRYPRAEQLCPFMASS